MIYSRYALDPGRAIFPPEAAMTLNELKIQLESREDLAFLKHELKTYARNNIDCNASIPDSLRDQVNISTTWNPKAL